MSEAIVVALIAGGCSIVGQCIISRKNRKDADVKRAKREQSIDDRLNAIEHKLDVHNGYAEKLGDIQRDVAVLQKDVAVLAAKMELK